MKMSGQSTFRASQISSLSEDEDVEGCWVRLVITMGLFNLGILQSEHGDPPEAVRKKDKCHS